ncbi:RNA ligase RtcB family protein [Pleionea sediminis]|uniref:RNA ligase RtcB family protein n=1 Tax=Pleionea sediminis TaxID=2569479 RepID=UPI0011866072|nr:RNA ligase RtcB family protein [Pleionea sediminis]
MGNFIQKLSERVRLVASSDTWIEGKAIQQLKKTAELEGIFEAAGMPDLHPGRGYPIGAVFTSRNKIYPALVGNDIGCGMSLWSTNIKNQKVNLDKFEKRLVNIDTSLDDSWNQLIEQRFVEKKIQNVNYNKVLGTIGGGNHFAELQQVDTVIHEKIFDSTAIDKKALVLLVHSGSRGLGERVLRHHVDQFGHQGLEVGSESFNQYMEQHQEAIKFAELNREFIARRMLNCLRSQGRCLLDVNHNLVSKYQDSQLGDIWIHRKGATPADKGLVMIPGSRGDYSYLVKPLIHTKESQESLLSLAHGAGRKWMRSECKDRLSKRYKKSDLERTALGSRVICKSKDLIYEEAPEAYKSIDSVIQAMENARLIKPIARFKPVLTYKTQGGC